ncbi:MAG: TetR/AcrR family transcriptional regulator [Pseudomonadales bacterium]|nr:TetR/AcrR family transcriptional regulator [Pseudomonadales bacterium]
MKSTQRIRDKSQRKQQIQDAASALILKKGYNATKIEDIAKHIDLTPGALYRHFKNKDELFSSLLIEALDILYQRVAHIQKLVDTDATSKILAYKNALYETYSEYPLMVRCIVHVQLEGGISNISKEAADKITNRNREIVAVLLNIFEEGIEQGLFRSENPVVYSDICWGLFNGVILWEEAKAHVNPKNNFLKSTLDKSFLAFLNGISTQSLHSI